MTLRRMAVDACVLINLLATDRIAEIAAANDLAIVIVREVADETFFLRSDDPTVERTRVDLDVLRTAGTIDVVDLDDNELPLFVAYAAVVDDGEAATIAVAQRRGLPLATDDRGAVRLIAREGLHLELHRTTAIVRKWAETGVSDAAVAAALTAIELRASFVPSLADPHYAWWRSSATTKMQQVRDGDQRVALAGHEPVLVKRATSTSRCSVQPRASDDGRP